MGPFQMLRNISLRNRKAVASECPFLAILRLLQIDPEQPYVFASKQLRKSDRRRIPHRCLGLDLCRRLFNGLTQVR